MMSELNNNDTLETGGSEEKPASWEKSESAAGEDSTSKFLSFSLADEIYGLEILKVREIIGMLPVTRMPRTPEYVRGVINLRGKVIPVVDLRAKFAMESAEETNETCIIVVTVEDDMGEVLIGLLVDSVKEVLDISDTDIEETPELGGSVESQYISGIGKAGDKVIILLDISRVLDLEHLRVK